MEPVSIIFVGIIALGSTAVLPDDLDSKLCGKNEEMGWVSGCDQPSTCHHTRSLDPVACRPMPSMPACVCKDGFYNNFLGQCISEEQCAQCSKPNEFFACDSACDNECSKIQTQNRTFCPIKNIQCNKRCYCEDGYARDEIGDCVPVDQCGPSCADRNEEYTLGKSCPPDLCASTVVKFNCDSNEVEQHRCRCKPGYLREKEGSPCKPISQCPQLNSPEHS